MPSFYRSKINKNLLIVITFICLISFTTSIIPNNNNYNGEKQFLEIEKNCDIRERYNFLRKLSYSCAKTSYSKSDIKEECDDGPSSYDRILKYRNFQNYISSHDYHSNGLNYVTSLFVDEETHHFGNFMNDGVGIIILYIIDCLMIIGWIPLICCWRKRCCLFDECIYTNECCGIFWHILTYFLAAAILSFLIVVLCFGE